MSHGVGLFIGLSLLTLVGTSDTVRAQGVLSQSAGARILEFLKPYAPGETVVEPWRIKNIAIVHDRVEIELVSETENKLIQLVPRGQSRNRSAQSKSFDIVLPKQAPSADVEAYRAAGEALVGALIRGDTGGLYVRVGKRSAQSDHGDDESEPMEPAEPLLPMHWLLLIGLVMSYMLALIGFRRSQLALSQSEKRAEWGLAFLVLAVGAGLRLSMGPYSLLHENFHAPVLMEQLAGEAAATRPMAGVAGLNALIDFLIAFDFDRLFALTVFLSAIQPLLVFRIARALQLQRKPSLLAAFTVAAAPLYIRLASSDLAFVPGTTFLLAAVWLAIEAGRRRESYLLCAAAICVSVAGHFRPVLYTCIVPVVAAAWLQIDSNQRWVWLRQRGVVAAVLLYGAFTFDDLGPIVDSIGEGTALAPGWWQGTGIRSWPVVDPEVTPAWVTVLGVAGLTATLRYGKGFERATTLWLLGTLAWISFWLTSVNGWPSALRYASAYGWIPSLWLAYGYRHALRFIREERVVFGMAALLVLTQPVTHIEWIDRHYAPQKELAFQRELVLPFLAEQESSLVATPWREIDRVGGSFLAGEARGQGHRIVPHSLVSILAKDGRRNQELFWYRGLSCWARSVRGAAGRYDDRGFNLRCKEIEESLSVVPVPGLVKRLVPTSDADWIELGTGREKVEIGLFRAMKR